MAAPGLFVLALGIAAVLTMQMLGIPSPAFYLVPAVVMIGGIGFTMALFIAQLAFPEGLLLETAKLAILCGSGFAAVISLLVGYRVLKIQ